MAMRNLELQENGSKHIFRLVVYEGRVRGSFFIRKDGGNDTLPIDFSEKVTLELIEEAWKLAGNKWVQEYYKKKHPDGAYEALRVITLSNGIKIVWYVFHQNDSPADTLEEWSEDWTVEDIALAKGFEDCDLVVASGDE